jgi:hypothetical protein
MTKKLAVTIVSGVLFTLFALGTTACGVTQGTGNLPQAFPSASATATAVATDTPTPAPTAVTTPQARDRTPNGDKSGRVLTALRDLGLTGGVVSANSGRALSLNLGKASQQIQVGTNTIVVIPDKSNPRVSDIRVGDRVIADVPGGDANATATLLLDFPAGYTADNVLTGAVQSSKGGAVALRTRKGPRSLTTSAATVVVNISQDQPTIDRLGDLQPGNAVLVIGQDSGDAFNAQVIVVIEKSVKDLGRGKQSPVSPTPKPGA